MEKLIFEQFFQPYGIMIFVLNGICFAVALFKYLRSGCCYCGNAVIICALSYEALYLFGYWWGKCLAVLLSVLAATILVATVCELSRLQEKMRAFLFCLESCMFDQVVVMCAIIGVACNISYLVGLFAL
jgi:hypothetical protein